MPAMSIKKLNELPTTFEANTLYLTPDPSANGKLITTLTSMDGTILRESLTVDDVNTLISQTSPQDLSTFNVRVRNPGTSQARMEVLDGETWSDYAFTNEFEPLIKKADLVTKTNKMTQEVGIDANSRLFTAPPGVKTFVQTYELPNVGDVCNIILDGVIVIRYEKTTNGGYEGYRVVIYSQGGSRTIGFRRDTTYDNTSLEGVNSNNLVLTDSTPYVSDSLSYGSMREFTRKVIIDYATMVSWRVDIFGFQVGKLRFIIERQEDTGPPTDDLPDPENPPIGIP